MFVLLFSFTLQTFLLLMMFTEPGPEPERDMDADDGPPLGDDNVIDFPGARF